MDLTEAKQFIADNRQHHWHSPISAKGTEVCRVMAALINEVETLTAANEELTRERDGLKEQRGFDAARLRRLAKLVGLENALPDDATVEGCAGTVLGMIAREVEQMAKERDKMSAVLGGINHHCVTAMPECSGQPLEVVVGELASRLQTAESRGYLKGIEDAARVAATHSTACFGGMYSKQIAEKIRALSPQGRYLRVD